VWEPRELRVPDWCPSDTLKKLIEECWHPDPAMRPTFSKILAHHSFPRILLEAEIYDSKARDFWSKYFLVETAVRCSSSPPPSTLAFLHILGRARVNANIWAGCTAEADVASVLELSGDLLPPAGPRLG
jgi:hypothetical protein